MTIPEFTGDDRSLLADLFDRLGRELSSLSSIDAVLRTITERALAAIPSAEHAAISRGRNGRFETVMPSSDLPPRVDQVQYELRSGPCVDAILEDTAFRTGNLRDEERWPEFGRRVADQFGVHSMLSVRMFLEGDDLLAGLNLYSGKIDAFDRSDQTTATLLATHGALALSAAARREKIGNLELALQSNRRIGTAIGILMASHRLTDQQAFDLLRIASQSTHRKLADIAEQVTLTGALELPDIPQRRDPS